MTDPLRSIRSRALVLPPENIDTDQIVPARYLTTMERDGLGAAAFRDWRFDAAGELHTDCVLNDPRAAEAAILVTGHNFGCGSSREHAPWALHEFGVRAVISTGIADIFRANAGKNGIVPVIVPEHVHAELLAQPWREMTVDVEACELLFGDRSPVPFPLDPFVRHCLLEGVDELGYLLSNEDSIRRFESGLRS